MNEQRTEKKTQEVPTAGGAWSKIGGARFDKERGKIDWTWKGKETLVLTPGSCINFWRNEDAFEGQPEFSASCKIAGGEGTKGSYKADHPTSGQWHHIGGGFLKKDKNMISWSWTGERSLEMPPGSQLSIWKGKKERPPEFQVRCKLTEMHEPSETTRTPAKDNAVDEWMSTGGTSEGQQTEAYRAPGAEKKNKNENEREQGTTGETQQKQEQEPPTRQQGGIDPKTLGGNPAQDPNGITREEKTTPQTQTYDDFDDIPF